MDDFTFDDACRHVGRLYLTGQQELARQEAVLSARIKQLEAELAGERTLRVEAERALACKTAK